MDSDSGKSNENGNPTDNAAPEMGRQACSFTYNPGQVVVKLTTMRFLRRFNTWLLVLGLALLLAAFFLANWPLKKYSPGDELIQVTNSTGKRGAINQKGELILPCIYEILAGPWRERWVVRKDDKVGTLNLSGETVIPLEYEEIAYSNDKGWATAKKQGRFGIIDCQGRVIIHFEWDEIHEVQYGMYCVTRKGLIGWVDEQGKVVIPIEWESVGSLHGTGPCYVSKNGKFGAIDSKGQVVIPLEWDHLGYFDSKGFAEVVRGKKHGWIDRQGNVVIPLEWDKVESFWEDYAAVRKGDKWGAIDRQGKLVIPVEWDSIHHPHRNGWFAVQKEQLWGWINVQSKVKLPPQWHSTYGFDQHGWTRVRKDGKTGFIDQTGKIVLPLVWDGCGAFQTRPNHWEEPFYEWASVTQNGQQGFIDRQGNITFPLVWDSAEILSHRFGYLQVQKGRAYGLVDIHNQILIPPNWDNLWQVYGKDEDTFYFHCIKETNKFPPLVMPLAEKVMGWLGKKVSRTTTVHIYDSQITLLWASDDWRHDLHFYLGLPGALLIIIGLWRCRNKATTL